MAERFVQLGREGREGIVRIEGESGCPWLSLALMPGDTATGGPTVQQRLRPSDARTLAEALLAMARVVDGAPNTA